MAKKETLLQREKAAGKKAELKATRELAAKNKQADRKAEEELKDKQTDEARVAKAAKLAEEAKTKSDQEARTVEATKQQAAGTLPPPPPPPPTVIPDVIIGTIIDQDWEDIALNQDSQVQMIGDPKPDWDERHHAHRNKYLRNAAICRSKKSSHQ